MLSNFPPTGSDETNMPQSRWSELGNAIQQSGVAIEVGVGGRSGWMECAFTCAKAYIALFVDGWWVAEGISFITVCGLLIQFNSAVNATHGIIGGGNNIKNGPVRVRTSMSILLTIQMKYEWAVE